MRDIHMDIRRIRLSRGPNAFNRFYKRDGDVATATPAPPPAPATYRSLTADGATGS